MAKKKKQNASGAVTVLLDDQAKRNLDFLKTTYPTPPKAPQIFRDALATFAEEKRAALSVAPVL